MNKAVEVLKCMFLDGEQTADVFSISASQGRTMSDYFAPHFRHSLFGPSGTKEMLVGRDDFFVFVSRSMELLAFRRDEIMTIDGIDEQCAFVRARAWRTSKATGEEIRYEWAMLYRVENGQITYGADMLDTDAQAFWARIAG